MEFFEPVMPVTKDRLDMLYLSDGSFSGDAIVRFDSEQDRKKAMGKNGSVVDARTINLIKITPEEYFVVGELLNSAVFLLSISNSLCEELQKGLFPFS